MNKTYLIAGGVAVAGLAFYLLFKGSSEAPDGGGGGFFQKVGAAAGGAVVDAVDGVVSGVVLGIGDKVGVPRTNKTECHLAMEQGRTLDASFACPAGTFLKYIF